jgi:hypothetical protein
VALCVIQIDAVLSETLILVLLKKVFMKRVTHHSHLALLFFFSCLVFLVVWHSVKQLIQKVDSVFAPDDIDEKIGQMNQYNGDWMPPVRSQKMAINKIK